MPAFLRKEKQILKPTYRSKLYATGMTIEEYCQLCMVEWMDGLLVEWMDDQVRWIVGGVK